MLAVYIQYKYIYITKCQLNLLIGIGYILPTFGEDAQGRGMYIFNIWICIVCLLPTFGQYMSVEFINWRAIVRSYSLVADNCKILQFYSSDSWSSDSCPLWQKISDSCLLTGDHPKNWNLLPRPFFSWRTRCWGGTSYRPIHPWNTQILQMLRG